MNALEKYAAKRKLTEELTKRAALLPGFVAGGKAVLHGIKGALGRAGGAVKRTGRAAWQGVQKADKAVERGLQRVLDRTPGTSSNKAMKAIKANQAQAKAKFVNMRAATGRRFTAASNARRGEGMRNFATNKGVHSVLKRTGPSPGTRLLNKKIVT